jgi:hypothetical protein
MIGIGSYFAKRALSKINRIYGYRTAMSMKNKDTWLFAHTHCGKTWQTLGLILLPLSIGPMLFTHGFTANNIALLGCIIILIQMFFLLGSVIFTEKALKNTFDKNGNRKRKTTTKAYT